MSKRSSNKAAGESKPEAYPLGYVEDFDDPRTPLGNVFTSLLAEEGHHGQAHQQIVDRVSQNARQQTPCFLIHPSPEDATPQDADEADQSLAMGDGEDARADQRGRQEAELSAQDGEQEPAKREFLKHGRKDHVFD